MSEDQSTPPAETGKKKKGGMALTVVAAVIAASGGAFAGITFLGAPVGEKLVASAQEDGETTDDGHGGGHDDGYGSNVEVHVIDNLVVNPAGSGATRFLLASVAIAPGDEADADELTARDVELRDGLLRLLGSKTVDELADIQLRSALTDEMLQVLEDLLGEGWVERVYLPQFVIQ